MLDLGFALGEEDIDEVAVIALEAMVEAGVVECEGRQLGDRLEEAGLDPGELPWLAGIDPQHPDRPVVGNERSTHYRNDPFGLRLCRILKIRIVRDILQLRNVAFQNVTIYRASSELDRALTKICVRKAIDCSHLETRTRFFQQPDAGSFRLESPRHRLCQVGQDVFGVKAADDPLEDLNQDREVLFRNAAGGSPRSRSSSPHVRLPKGTQYIVLEHHQSLRTDLETYRESYEVQSLGSIHSGGRSRDSPSLTDSEPASILLDVSFETVQDFQTCRGKS